MTRVGSQRHKKKISNGKLYFYIYFNEYRRRNIQGYDVRNDLKKMKLIKWTEQLQDRLKWKAIVEKAKTVSEL